MKIDHSIGAALRACAPQVPAREPQRLSAPAARGRDHRFDQDLQRNRDGAPDHGVDEDGDFGRDCPTATHRLTPRQLEVLVLLCEGLQNKVICRRLRIASGTVKVHISCIFRELGVKNRLAAVVEAQRRGLTKPGNALPEQSRDFLDTFVQRAGGPRTPSIHAKQAAAMTVDFGIGCELMMAA